MRILLPVLLIASLSACGVIGFPGVYRINVEQGNIVTQEMVDQLKPGMSKRQVRFIMGTPLVEDTFNQDRWDYAYTIRNGGELLASSHVTVFFDGDALVNITGDKLPEWAGGPSASEGAQESDSEAEMRDSLQAPAAEES